MFSSRMPTVQARRRSHQNQMKRWLCDTNRRDTAADPDRGQLPVVLLFEGQTTRWWLHLAIEFSKDNRWLLSRIGVSAFHGLVSSDGTRILRAEWAGEGAPTRDGTSHAQPHWHFSSVLGRDEVTAEGADAVDLVLAMEHFHFAMCSTWHDHGGHETAFQDTRAVANWICGCVSYVRDELRLVSGRMV